MFGLFFLVQTFLLNTVISYHPCHHTEGSVCTFPRNTTHGKRWNWDRGICWTLPLCLPPLSGILPCKSCRAEARAGAGRAAALGGTFPWWELLLLPLCWSLPLIAMLPGQLAPGQRAAGALTSIFPPRKLDFYETSPTVFFKSFWLQLLSSFFPSHSQHSASCTCKENMPSHSKTSIYSQALPSPLKKVWITVLSGYTAENVAYRTHAFGASTIKVQRHIVWRSVFLKTKNLFGFWFAFILLVYSIVHVARRQLQGNSCSQRKSQWFIWILLPFCLHLQ